MASMVSVTLSDGRELAAEADVSVPVRDLPAQQAKLERKFRRLVRGVLNDRAADAVVDIVRNLEREPDVHRLLTACSEGLRA